MPSRLRKPLPFRTVLAGLFLLTASASLFSQTAASADPAQHPKLKAWRDAHPESLPTTEGWKFQARAWESFLLKLGFHPATPAQERECQCTRRSRSNEFGITPEEERFLMDTAYPSRQRLDQLRIAFHESITGPNQVSVEEQQRRLLVFNKGEADPILIAMIAQIKAGMSEQSYKHLDAFVYAESNEGRWELIKMGIKHLTAYPSSAQNPAQVVRH